MSTPFKDSKVVVAQGELLPSRIPILQRSGRVDLHAPFLRSRLDGIAFGGQLSRVGAHHLSMPLRAFNLAHHVAKVELGLAYWIAISKLWALVGLDVRKDTSVHKLRVAYILVGQGPVRCPRTEARRVDFRRLEMLAVRAGHSLTLQAAATTAPRPNEMVQASITSAVVIQGV